MNQEELCNTIERLEARIVELEKTVLQLQEENGSLRARLQAYENANTPPSLNKRKRSQRPPTGGAIGAPVGHEGTTRPTPEPDKIVNVKPSKNCPNCNAQLNPPESFEKQIREDIPEPQPVIVTQYNLPHQTCPCCGLEIVTTHPDCPESGRFGFNTLTNVTLLKYDGRLPHRKIVDVLKRDYKMNITPATVLDINYRVQQKVSPEYQKILTRIRLSPFVYVDETGLRVSGAHYWVWVFTTETDTLIVIRYSRGKNVLQEILEKYAGIIICDGHKAYPNFTNRIQRCWAHLLREAKHYSEQFPQAMPFYHQLRLLYRRLVNRYRSNLENSQRYRFWGNANKRLQQILDKYSVVKPLQKLLDKIKNGGRHWFTFLLHPEIESTNNRAERALRETVVQRKIFGCLRNQKGTTIMETIMSLIATWKQQGLNPRNELLNTLRS